MKTKIFKQNSVTLKTKDITLWTHLKSILLIVISVSVTYLLLTSFKTDAVVMVKEVVVRDTVQQLVVLKHGLTEVKVNRNKNIPTFCNNPANIRPSGIKEINQLAIGKIQSVNGEFLYFANPEHGYKAFEILLRKVYWNKTISEAINKFAPPCENNTSKYVQAVCRKLKITSDTKVKDVNLKKFMKIIAEIEGFKK